jgi:hypothetical protein
MLSNAMEASEQQFASLTYAKHSASRNPALVNHVHALENAEAYAWVDPAQAAVLEASNSVPQNVSLSRDQLPIGSGFGWFYFHIPLELPATTRISALLWGHVQNEPVLFLSGYEQVGNIRALRPTLQWRWVFGQSLTQMNATTTALVNQDDDSNHPDGRDLTLVATDKLSRFFLASCVWLQQKIVNVAPSPVQRHRRKAFIREHKLKSQPQLRIVALRQTSRATRYRCAPSNNNESVRREHEYQWVVSGHWRQQACGRDHADRKLIYIYPFVKGPADKPLKRVPQWAKVYVVRR